MRFSEWIEKRISEALNPELDRLRREEKLLIMSIEGRKNPDGSIVGVNKAGVIDAMNKLKEVRTKIKTLEGTKSDPDKVSKIPAWMHGKKAL